MQPRFSSANKGQRITATASSAFTQWSAGAQANLASVTSSILVMNPGPVGVYLITGNSAATPTADNASLYIPPNVPMVFNCPDTHNGVSLLSAGANQDIIITHGTGV